MTVGLHFIHQFGPHLDRLDSMFVSFGPTSGGGSILGSGREPADAAYVEGRPVRGDPAGLARQHVRAGDGWQIQGEPSHGPHGPAIGVAAAAQADAAAGLEARRVQADHR
jgi:hypothetical protein